MPGPDVVVVGSINSDIFLFQERLPARGETLLADGMREGFGGKGANQAVQAAKLGERVAFVGAVGADERGAACLENLRALGIDCRVAEVDQPTGLGIVHVLARGEVHATVVGGANDAVDAAYVVRHGDVFAGARYLILQNETPLDGVAEAIRLARKAGVSVVYNAAPARDGSMRLARDCDVLVVNEEEAMAYLGRRVESLDDMREALPELTAHCPFAIVTLGADGSLVGFRGEVHHIPPTPVDAVDTTGAGDSFVGALVCALSRRQRPLEAATLASAVAALTTTSVGAQTAMPTVRRGGSDDSLRAQTPDPGGAANI